jgi:hypothetical protein
MDASGSGCCKPGVKAGGSVVGAKVCRKRITIATQRNRIRKRRGTGRAKGRPMAGGVF